MKVWKVSVRCTSTEEVFVAAETEDEAERLAEEHASEGDNHDADGGAWEVETSGHHWNWEKNLNVVSDNREYDGETVEHAIQMAARESKTVPRYAYGDDRQKSLFRGASPKPIRVECENCGRDRDAGLPCGHCDAVQGESY